MKCFEAKILRQYPWHLGYVLQQLFSFTMPIRDYFKPAHELPDPTGPLSRHLPSHTIASVNQLAQRTVIDRSNYLEVLIQSNTLPTVACHKFNKVDTITMNTAASLNKLIHTCLVIYHLCSQQNL